MHYGPYARLIGHNVSLALVATSPTAQARVACFVTPNSVTAVPSAWLDVYQRAYEQARASVEPSAFQVMLQPCWN
jgi:hypothetical protein